MPATDRPNVLLYITDQQRADLMGCMGHPLIKTPHFDALAARGVLMRNFYIQGTVCMPSRSSIMTSTYPSTHGVTNNGYNLRDDLPTLGHTFRDAGYHTAVVGRTHIRCSRPHPILPNVDYYGFNECYHTQCYWDGLDPHSDYIQWIRDNHADWYEWAATPRAHELNRDDAMGASWNPLPDDKTMTAWVTRKSLEVVDRHRTQRGDQPLFLWAGTWDPHSRFMTAAPWDRMYNPADIPLPVRRKGELDDLPPYAHGHVLRDWQQSDMPVDDVIRNTLSIYWGMISHIDDQFGRLMRGLEQLDMLDNTIVVFMSDHGEMAGDHWAWAKGPYSFEGALRVPGIIAAPGRLPESHVTDALVETIDLMPTLADMCSIDVPSSVQGRSCRAVLETPHRDHRADVFTEHHIARPGRERLYSLRTERYRFTQYLDRPEGILFDLASDPDELHNRWSDPSYRDVRSALSNRLLSRALRHGIAPDTRQDLW